MFTLTCGSAAPRTRSNVGPPHSGASGKPSAPTAPEIEPDVPVQVSSAWPSPAGGTPRPYSASSHRGHGRPAPRKKPPPSSDVVGGPVHGPQRLRHRRPGGRTVRRNRWGAPGRASPAMAHRGPATAGMTGWQRITHPGHVPPLGPVGDQLGAEEFHHARRRGQHTGRNRPVRSVRHSTSRRARSAIQLPHGCHRRESVVHGASGTPAAHDRDQRR